MHMLTLGSTAPALSVSPQTTSEVLGSAATILAAGGGGTPPIPAPTPTSPSPCLELSLVPRKPTSPRAPKNARACPQGTFTH